MKAIVEAIPEFECRCNIQRYGKVIEVMDGDGVGSIYESLSADDKRAHGLAASLWIYDEFAQAPNALAWANAPKAWVWLSRRRLLTISTRLAK